MFLELLGAIGLTFIIVYSHIIGPIREGLSKQCEFINKLLHCAMCTGFWVGCFVDLLMVFCYNMKVSQFLMFPFAVSFCSYFLSHVINYLKGCN